MGGGGNNGAYWLIDWLIFCLIIAGLVFRSIDWLIGWLVDSIFFCQKFPPFAVKKPVGLLRDILRGCTETAGFTGQGELDRDIVKVIDCTAAAIYNSVGKLLPDANHVEFFELWQLRLTAVRFRSLSSPFTAVETTLASETTSATAPRRTWSDLLCSMLRPTGAGVGVFQRVDVSLAAVYRAVMSTVGKCSHVTVADVLTVNAELAAAWPRVEAGKLPEKSLLTDGLSMADPSGKFRPQHDQLLTVIRAKWIMREFRASLRAATNGVYTISVSNAINWLIDCPSMDRLRVP